MLIGLLMLMAAAQEPVSVTLGDGEDAPTVLALHGLGDRPETFAAVFAGMPGPARLLLPAAPHPWGQGGSWMPSASVAALVEAADALAATLTEPVAVTGFSQGGALSFVLAVRHPTRILAAFPVSGALPLSLIPDEAPASAPPIIALHGEADAQVDIKRAKSAVRALRKSGYAAELRSYPGVGHSMPPQLRADLSALLTGLSADQER